MPPRRGRGRPTQAHDLQDPILDAAELAFARSGFDGTGLREIAAAAGVSQALLRYYFGAKQDLFDAVFRRRGRQLAARRLALLADLGPDAPVQGIIAAYLRPQWDMKMAGGNAAAFLSLQARVHASTDPHLLALRADIYDAPLGAYVDALTRVLPLPRPVIARRMGFLVGSYLFVLNDLARLDMVSGRPTDAAKVLSDLTVFLSAGLSAPV